MYPSELEMFVRAFLASRLSGPADTKLPCLTAADCTGCSALAAECVTGMCTCPVAFYHTALDPGLEAEAVPGLFQVVDQLSPLYAEPNWVSIGIESYETAGSDSELLWWLACGVAVAVSSVSVSVSLARKVVL